MKKMRITLITAATLAATVIALLTPASASALGVFYCSYMITEGGDGSYANPWACNTGEQFDYIVYDVICPLYGGGHLYRIYDDNYVYYLVEWDGDDCEATFVVGYPGYPPNTGVELTPPLITGAAIAGGAGLLLVGLTLRRKKRAS